MTRFLKIHVHVLEIGVRLHKLLEHPLLLYLRREHLVFIFNIMIVIFAVPVASVLLAFLIIVDFLATIYLVSSSIIPVRVVVDLHLLTRARLEP